MPIIRLIVILINILYIYIYIYIYIIIIIKFGFNNRVIIEAEHIETITLIILTILKNSFKIGI